MHHIDMADYLDNIDMHHIDIADYLDNVHRRYDNMHHICPTMTACIMLSEDPIKSQYKLGKIGFHWVH